MGMPDDSRASDERLMKRYADGDAAAFEELFSRYEQRAYAFFFRRTGSDDRAKDLYQELFLRLHRSRDSYDSTRPFAPWFFRIAGRLLVDDLRRAFRNREVSLPDHDAPRVDGDAEQRVEQAQQVGWLLDRLSPEERRVLVAAKVEGVGYAELARDLGKSVAAVKKLASRAMQRIREMAAPVQLPLPEQPPDGP
jgi:RNA polymerase sigma-70 factor (ECF subfamily)